MQEIRTSGSMSGDGKRSVAAWPKLPRPSSTLPELPSRNVRIHGEYWRVSGPPGLFSTAVYEITNWSLAAKFAVVHRSRGCR